MSCGEDFIEEVCKIVGTHHDHPENPSTPFKILYDSDKIVMFSPEEFPIYNERPNFDWNKIIELIYSEKGKDTARLMLANQTNEKRKITKSPVEKTSK